MPSAPSPPLPKINVQFDHIKRPFDMCLEANKYIKRVDDPTQPLFFLLSQ